MRPTPAPVRQDCNPQPEMRKRRSSSRPVSRWSALVRPGISNPLPILRLGVRLPG